MGLAHSKIYLSEKTGASELLEGEGVSEFQSFSEEKSFLCLPLVSTCVIWVLLTGISSVTNSSSGVIFVKIQADF